jgi:hypothetical protein
MSGSQCARFLVLACVVGLVPSVCATSRAGLQAVWAVDDGEKIFRDDITSALKTGRNSVWDGTRVYLFGCRNEIVAFQVILEADAAGADQVNVVVSDLTNGTDTIKGSDPLPAPNDYLGVGVELFAEHYLDITIPSWDSPCGGFGWDGNSKTHLTGWTPDALVPFSAAPGKGGAPFDIAGSLNQGVWVDIYVPKDAPVGSYTGIIAVTVGGAPNRSIPISLEVLGPTLPDENHYQTMVFYSRDNILRRHDVGWCTPEMWEMVLDYNRMAHRHRIDLIGCGNWDEINNLAGTLSGEAYTAAHNYAGPGEGVGNQVFSINTYGIHFSPETEEGYWAESDAWVNWFTANAPNVDYFVYLTDEPGPDMYPWVIERAGWIHDNPGPGGSLPVLMTRGPIDDLIGAIDIWCMPPSYYDPAAAAEAFARGEQMWLYASYRPWTTADCTDEYGIAWRAKAWIGHYRDIERWFTWESTHWNANPNEVDAGGWKNVWENPITFWEDSGGGVPCPGGTGNGDGTMFYPGQDAIYPDEDRGYPGPISSIRMKMYRRGIQDVEYMWLAEQGGHESEVDSLITSLIPHNMWEYATTPDWSNYNLDYDVGRWQLADLLGPRPTFRDVPSTWWAAAAIDACWQAGIVSGYSDATYRPMLPVTRDQMAVYISRALAGGDAGVPSGPAVATFPDVPTDYWAFKYVEYAAANSIVAGYPGGNYRPTWQVDRGQMAVFIARSIVTPHGDEGLIGYTPPATPTFSDVPTDHWAYMYVEYIAGQGVASGYWDGTYRPTVTVTRDQMAVYVQRAFKLAV